MIINGTHFDENVLTEKEMLENYIRYRNDPWAFLTECVYTLDSVDAVNPVKLYPNRDYLKLFVRLWQRYKLIAVPKSRRMTMSWTCIGLELWDAIFHTGKFGAFVSKKEEDAGELIKRAKFILDHIPKYKIHPSMLPRIEERAKPPALKFPDIHSALQGFPMGADQLRQFTFSSIFGDESAFWPEAEAFYTGAKPTLDGGGRMTLVSSVAPGLFQQICFDTLDQPDNYSEEPPPGAIVKYPMTGVRVWQNPKNKFLVFDLDMTADPKKRSKEYETAISGAMTRNAFLQEYKRKWIVFSGKPVFPDFSTDIHCTDEDIYPELGLPILCGWDFGLSPACIVGQLVGNQLRILQEFTATAEAIITFAPKVMSQLRQLYPQWNREDDYRHFIDPAGFKRSETDARTCAGIMEEYAGIRKVFPGAPLDNNWEARKSAVERRLIRVTKEGPALLISQPNCKILVKGFEGGYAFGEQTQGMRSDQVRPVKNIHSHIHDAQQYLCYGIANSPELKQFDIPTPQYAFSPQERVNKHGINE